MVFGHMATDRLRYDRMMEQAYRSVVRQALIEAAEHGLPGGHHFYISYRTQAPGVEMPDYLVARFPHEILIVLEHQFWGLEVDEEKFAVTLSFNSRGERLVVPFSAITSFRDPSVSFSLLFPPPGTEPEAALSILALNAGDAQEGETGAGQTQDGQAAPAGDAAAQGGSVEFLHSATERPPAAEGSKDPAEAPAKGAGEVITLDSFRRR